MYIGFNPGSIVDLDGKPLAGRVTLYQHDSDTLLDVYTLEGDDYVQAQNPLLLNGDGRMHTLFFEVGITDIKVEKYVGPEGQMSVSSDDFEDFDFFEYGIDVDLSGAGAQIASSINALKQLDPSISNSVVTVAPTDGSPVRNYVWDASSTDSIDGGYVVGSDVSDTGRWILLWGDEQLPSSIYGVVDGDCTNINALLSYPSQVGSFSLRTAPIVRMERGTYDSALTYNTAKTLAFDFDSKWTHAIFSCPSVLVNGKNTDYISDFMFSSNVEAHSSWFRTVDAWWKCGAERLVIDNTNYFANDTLSSSVMLTEVTIEGSKPVATTYASGAYLAISKCTILGMVFDGSTDYIKFSNTEFKSEWFTNQGSLQFGTIAGGQRIEVKTSAANTLRLSNMAPSIYADAMKANGSTTIDFQGASLSGLVNDQFTSVKNLIVTGNLSISVSSCTLENVTASNLYATGSSLYMTKCNVNFLGQSLTDLEAVDSEVTNSSTWTTIPAITLRHCRVGLSINTVTDNNTQGRAILMEGCILYPSDTIVHKQLLLVGCQVNCAIKIRPFKVDSDYYFNARFEGCQFVESDPVEFDLFRGTVSDKNCHDIKFNCSILGNTFRGNSSGITMPYWAWASDGLKMIATSGNAYLYHGNSGNCPADKPTLKSISSNFNEYDLSGTSVWKYISSFRAFPELNSVLATASFERCAGGWPMCATGTSVQSFFFMFRDRATVSDDTDFFAITMYFTSNPTGVVRLV